MDSKENNNELEKGNNPLITTFLALWTDESGPQIIDFYPFFNIGDPEKLAIHIFTIYQLFLENPDNKFQSSNFTIPITKLNRIAIISFDIISNPEIRGGFQPFIIVFLVPEYISKEQIELYNKIQVRISRDFIRKKKISLKNYYQDVINTLTLSESVKEPPIIIDEYYSYTAAMEDFQAGIKLFQTNNFIQAYSVLKKVLLKFEKEKHKHLIMEVLYLLGSILTQQKKFNAAKKYFDQLEEYAADLNHQRYIEISFFMKGFFEYKNENYASAKVKLEKIDILKSQFINKLQYHTIYAKVLEYYENYKEAIQNLLTALKIARSSGKSNKIKKQESQILYQIGVLNYKIAAEDIKFSGIRNINAIEPFLKEAIKYLLNSTEILIELNDFDKIVSVFQLIGNLYETIGNDIKFFEYYRKAMEYANKKNFVEKRIRIINRIVQKQTNLNMHEENIKLINDFLVNAEEQKFVDLYTISVLRWDLGNSFFAIGKKSEGLSELIKVYDTFKNFKIPVNEQIEILNQLIEIYAEINNHEKLNVYKNELKKISNKIENYPINSPTSYHPLEPLKEIWIYSTSTGVGLYNYSPETKVDIDLLGGLMTAMQQFSLELSQHELQNMVIGEDRYMIYKERDYDFFILGRFNAKIPLEIGEKILSKIYRRFWKEFNPEIKNFQGNISVFKGFTKIIESLDLTLINWNNYN